MKKYYCDRCGKETITTWPERRGYILMMQNCKTSKLLCELNCFMSNLELDLCDKCYNPIHNEILKILDFYIPESERNKET